MKHFASEKFWQRFDALPAEVKKLARQNYKLLKTNPSHPSLHFKPIGGKKFWSVRVGISYRALGIPVPDGINWFWIGTHAEYDRLVK